MKRSPCFREKQCYAYAVDVLNPFVQRLSLVLLLLLLLTSQIQNAPTLHTTANASMNYQCGRSIWNVR